MLQSLSQGLLSQQFASSFGLFDANFAAAKQIGETSVDVAKRLRQDAANVGQIEKHQRNAKDCVHDRHDTCFGTRRSNVSITNRRDDGERVEKGSEKIPLGPISCEIKANKNKAMKFLNFFYCK